MDEQLNHYQAKLAYEIDAYDLNELRSGGGNVVVVDARPVEAYDREHIPGAISLPHRSMNVDVTAHLDRASLIVTYCDGIGCNASTKGALAMTRLGFRVRELMGGLDWWKRDGYPTSAAGGAVGHDACGCG